MENRTAIWVNLQTAPGTTDLSAQVGLFCQLYNIREIDKVAGLIRALSFRIIFFEYDDPSAELLEPLRRLVSEFPESRFVMITQQHSESLAVWALRARVWDYLVKPVDLSYLLSCVDIVLNREDATTSTTEHENRRDDRKVTPNIDKGSNLGDRLRAAPRKNQLSPALTFVKANYAEKVSLGAAAQLCGLGRYQFSRAFKQVHGMTFREFVITYRIQRAEQMLFLANSTITDVAFSVGFNDLSHFAQMFRRYVGLRPSEYVEGTRKKATQMHISHACLPKLGATQNYRVPFAKES